MAPGCLSVNSTAAQQTKSTSSAAGSLTSHAQVLKQEQWRIQPDLRLRFKLKTLLPLQEKLQIPSLCGCPLRLPQGNNLQS